MEKRAAPQPVRRVVGKSANGPGSICGLALAIAAEARGFGLDVAETRLSRGGRFSTSRYLAIADRERRRWCLRVSDHYRPRTAPYDPPHFDLVSLDGRSGLGEARAFLVAIVAGDAPWFERRDRTRRPRRRPNQKRLCGGRRGA